MYVDLGVWFAPRAVLELRPWDAKAALRGMEKWLREHAGYQAPYGTTEQTREEHRQMFDHTLLDKCREKYGAQGVFMEAFDKIRRR